MSREAYLKALLRVCGSKFYAVDVILFMWHAEVPIEDARRYLETVRKKLALR